MKSIPDQPPRTTVSSDSRIGARRTLRLACRIGWWALAPVAALVLWGEFQNVDVRRPDDWMLSTGGDGIRNLFALGWQVDGGPPSIRFTGLNAPFGDLLTFVDGQTPLALLAQTASWMGASWTGVGWSNLGLLASVAVGVVAAMAVLRSMTDLAEPVCAVWAVAVVLSSPSQLRVAWHPALAHGGGVLPVAVLVSILYWRHRGRGRVFAGLAMIAIGLWTVFLHPYLGLMVSGWWLAALAAFGLLTVRDLRRRPTGYVMFLVSTVLPLVAFVICLRLADSAGQRVSEPSLMGLLTSGWSSFVIPLVAISDQRTMANSWEGSAFLGTGPVALLALTIAWMVGRALRRRSEPGAQCRGERHATVPLQAWFTALVFGALGLLALSTGLIFEIVPFLSEAPLLRQFRALGRFSWPLHCVLLLALPYWIDRLVRNRSVVIRAVAGLTLVMVPMTSVLEARSMHRLEISPEYPDVNLYRRDLLPRSQAHAHLAKVLGRVDPAGYQGILPLPFFAVGSEGVGPELPGFQNLTLFSVLAVHWRLPLMAQFQARVSVPQTLELLGLLTPERYDVARPILDRLDDRPILVVWARRGELGPEEQELLGRAAVVAETPQFVFARLEPRDLATRGPSAGGWLAELDGRPGASVEESFARVPFAEEGCETADASPVEGYTGSGCQIPAEGNWEFTLGQELRRRCFSGGCVLHAWLRVRDSEGRLQVCAVATEDGCMPLNWGETTFLVDPPWVRLTAPLEAGLPVARIRFHNPLLRSSVVLDEVLVRPVDHHRVTVREGVGEASRRLFDGVPLAPAAAAALDLRTRTIN